MADDLAESNIDAQTDSIMEMLGVTDEDDGAPQAVADTPSADGEQPAGDPAPETVSGDDEDAGAVEPEAAPAIELPSSFPAELKDTLAKLDPDSQRKFAQWEADRQKGVSQKLEEAATIRKAAEATQAQLQPERQRLAQQLDAAITLTQNFDPVLAAGLKMSQADWAKVAQEDPAGYVQRKADFEARLGGLQAAVAQRNELQAADHGAIVQREHKALMDAVPELADPIKAKAFAGEFNATMASYGFQPNEIQGVVDHRMIKVARDAMLYRAGEAARAAAAAKIVKPTIPKVVRPGAGNATSGNAQTAALTQRALNATSTYDQAAALAALVERG